MEELSGPIIQQIGQAGLLGSLLMGAILLWWFERKLVTTCSDKLVEAWKSLGEIISVHNQTAREQILSQDARSRALEAQTRAFELSLQADQQRAEAARAVAQELKETRAELKEVRAELERLKELVRQGSR